MQTKCFEVRDDPYGEAQVIYDMPAREYHSDSDGPRLSQSLAKLCVQRSPLHAWAAHPLLGGSKYEGSDDDGTIVHSLVLEPDSPSVEVFDFDAWRSNASKAAKAACVARGNIPLIREKHGVYAYKSKAIRQRFEARGVTFDGDSEVVIYWAEETPSGPVRCRCRLDHLIVRPDRITIIDLKTTEEAVNETLRAHCYRYRYDIQCATYKRAVTAAFPDYAGRVDVLFAFCELDKPYAVNDIKLSAKFERMGEVRWERGRDLWAAALKADDWQGYPGGELEPPGWAETREMSE